MASSTDGAPDLPRRHDEPVSQNRTDGGQQRREAADGPLSRRGVLTRVVLASSAVVLGGCTTDALEDAERPPPPLEEHGVTSVDLPVTQPLGVAAAAIERTRALEVESLDAFRSAITDHRISVRDLTVVADGSEALISLQYVPGSGPGEGVMTSLGTVAGAFAALVDADHESRVLEATVLDGADEPFGFYEVRRAWTEAYLAGSLTAREYAEEIGTTVETG